MCSLGMCINYVHTLWLPGVLSKLFHFNSKILRDVVWILFKKRAKHKKSLCKCSIFASNFVLQNCKPHLFWFLIQNNLRTKLHAFILILKTCSAAKCYEKNNTARAKTYAVDKKYVLKKWMLCIHWRSLKWFTK